MNTFIRAFSANPAVNDDGIHIGGIIGFLKSLRYTLARIKPTRCIIVFDGKDGTKRRKKLYPQYKGNRKVKQRFNRNIDWSIAPQNEEQSIKMQLGRLIKYLEQLPLTIISIDGTEADDIIAYISKQLLTTQKIIITSTDKDFYQLIDDRITVWSPIKKVEYNINKIKEEFDIWPSNFLTYRALEGDKSDNINGIRGAALKSIKKYIPQITGDDEFGIKKLFEFVNNTDSKYKLIETIKNNVFLVKRNYLLMQLFSVDISNHIKLRVQESINRKVPTLIKYKFSTMFMQDKLWSQIPDMNSWITEFVRLDRFSKRDKNGSK
ncbi:hypothetical protein CL614_10725 [archaeon]|nr:hypothetical protein [archaeon]